jgi:hypothetical protein
MPPARPLMLELTLPGLVPEPADAWTAALHRLPALRRLVARARHSARDCEHLPAFLLGSFGVSMQEDWPAAPFCLLDDDADPGGHVWLRADPVHLLPQRSSLVLVDSRRLLLSAEENDALLAGLNRHLAQEGLMLSAPHPLRWYLRMPRQLRIRTTPTAAAVGHSVDALLPRGADALLVHGWVNEIQMFLHDHDVNAAREASGALTVNSLWLWGAGQLVQPEALTAGSVWSEDPLLRGLARASGLPVHEPPDGAEDWLARTGTGEHWILLDAPQTTADGDAAADWRVHAEDWERRWFAPLLDALSARRLRRLTLTTCHHGQVLRFSIAPGDLLKVWRQRASLVHG